MGGEPRRAVDLDRISIQEQGGGGLGCKVPQVGIRTFVAAQGWTLTAEVADNTAGRLMILRID